jgi:hypothetical protein
LRIFYFIPVNGKSLKKHHDTGYARKTTESTETLTGRGSLAYYKAGNRKRLQKLAVLKEENQMAEKNVQLSDDMMAQATGGVTETDPYGFVCEATVISGPGSSVTNGVAMTDYSVEADNGKSYLASWPYEELLRIGDRVQLIHNENGFYSLEPIPME